jgi:DNA invertase Pin-like site-specific DNA recombinase
MKAVILARVSTIRQEREGLSIREIQIPRLEEYCDRNEIEIAKEFVFSERCINELGRNLMR